MAKNLVIVESPAKAKTINKFLGKDFQITASYGHIRDLPKKSLGVNVDENFKPTYAILPDKRDLVKKLKKEAKGYEKIYLATDPDREGEAISWHLAHILKINNEDNCRITFNEITKGAVGSAIENSRPIDMEMVNSQQTRRILDRIVGYKISPLLWKKVRKGLSAGRVQSVTVRMICDREKEIEGFVPVEYWKLALMLSKKGDKGQFHARFYGPEAEKPKKLELNDKASVDEIIKAVKENDVKVRSVAKKKKKRYPLAPFSTSTLQQDASNKLGFTTKKTMVVAQQLYEGININGAGSVGLITYMRTDSLRISSEIQHAAKDHIISKFGAKYAPKAFNVYKSKGKSQDAHEAIRPVNLEMMPTKIKDNLSKDQQKLYKLIFDRFIASQMSPSVSDVTTVDFTSGGYIFRSTGTIIIFKGFRAVYDVANGKENENEKYIPELKKNEVVDLNDISKEQKFTKPPNRYTEASLVKALEEKGIGRPSTYSPTISTIIYREYIRREKKTLFPTDLGRVVNDVMEQGFLKIVDYNFTADLENKLDEIENGQADMLSTLTDFYNEFSEILDKAYKNVESKKAPDVQTDIECEECGRKMVIKEGRYGKFLACPGFPKCRNTKQLDEDNSPKKEEEVEESDVKCDKCGKTMVIKNGRYGKFLACPGFPECKNTKQIYEDTGHECPKCGGKVQYKYTKKRRKFIGCENYPDCDFTSWNMPVEENCPECGTFLTKGKIDKKPHLICPNPDCEYIKPIDEDKENQ